MPASAIAVAAFFAVAVLPRATWALIDPDVWWHVRAGETVLSTGMIPRIDTWSLTAAGHPWTSQDWAANVAMALLFRLGAWGGTLLSLVFAAVAVTAFVIVWRAIAVRLPSIGWLSRITWLSVGLLLAGPTLGVRVQVIDLLLAAIVVWLLWKLITSNHRRWIAGLPIVAIAWANLHAGWPLLFILGGAVLVGEAIDRLIGREGSISASPLVWKQVGWLAIGLIASAIALVLNPNGIDIYRYPLDTLALGTLKGAVGEWQPARLDNLFGWLLLGFGAVGVVPTLAFAWRRMRSADALILIGLTAMSVLAIRFLLVLGPIGGAIVALSLGPVISRSRVGMAFAPMLQRLGRPRHGGLGALNRLLAAALLLTGSALAVVRSLPATQAAEIEREQPVEATSWILVNDPGRRVFNRYEWGGYLGLHRPALPVFIDGRADVYGDEIIAEYVRTIGLSSDPQSTFDRYDVDYVLFPPDTPLAAWLNSSAAWTRTYTDGVAAVWVRAS